MCIRRRSRRAGDARELESTPRVLYTDNSVFMVTIVFEYYGLFTHRVSPSFRLISIPTSLFLLPSAPFETQMVIKTS